MKKLILFPLVLICLSLGADSKDLQFGNLKRWIRAMNADGSWSPDGKKIVFASDREGPWSLYIMNVDGTGMTRLTKHSTGDDTPSWSPDGSLIAFASGVENAYEIYVIHADGSGEKKLTNNVDDDIHPTWSPDGKRILFNSSRGSANKKDPEIYEIYSMNADGTDLRQITKDKAVSTFASYSPDGSKIVYRKIVPEKNSELFVMNEDGSHQSNISKNPGFDGWPSWSPDGRHIAFASDRSGSGNFKIYVMNDDGSDVKLVGDLPGRNTSPHWSPDGKHLSFDHSYEGSLDIFLMDRIP